MTASGFLRALLCAIVLTLAAPHAAQAARHPGPAPADEYFGPFKQSILGIRNHIADLERKADPEFAPERVLTGIDNLEVAIEDWHNQYPNDSWVPKFLDRLVHLYVRCHSGAHAEAKRALALLERDFPRSAYAHDARAVVTADASGPGAER